MEIPWLFSFIVVFQIFKSPSRPANECNHPTFLTAESIHPSPCLPTVSVITLTHPNAPKTHIVRRRHKKQPTPRRELARPDSVAHSDAASLRRPQASEPVRTRMNNDKKTTCKPQILQTTIPCAPCAHVKVNDQPNRRAVLLVLLYRTDES